MKQRHIFFVLLFLGFLSEGYSQLPEIIITEIMQNPSAVDDDFGEWFEIYNYGNETIDLNGWVIKDNDSDIDTIFLMSQLILPPGGYFVFGNQIDQTLNGGVPVNHQYENIALSNGEDELILIDPDGNEVDRVEWDNGATFPDPNGASMSLGIGQLENELGENWCVSTTPYGDGDLGTPGAENDCEVFNGIVLKITEVFPGLEGGTLTQDWFEITNIGTEAWVSGTNEELYFLSGSGDPNEASTIIGIDEIQPEQSVVVVIGDVDATNDFFNLWSDVLDLSQLDLGYTEGPELNIDGDEMRLWVGDTSSEPMDSKRYPITLGFEGRSYDFSLDTFSIVGNDNGAVATIVLDGIDGNIPHIGSPGNSKAIPVFPGLVITESFSGQSGEDLTEDWFEISNVSNADWIAADNPPLYYDDDSQDPEDAELILGLTEIKVGRSAIVVISDTISDAERFREVWSEVFDLDDTEIVFSDGAGLNGGGDAITLWSGDPNIFAPINVASYPDTEDFDGQSYDHNIGDFSIVDNISGARATIQLGGNDGDVPNIGSPGAIFFDNVNELLKDPSLFNVFPNPTKDKLIIEQVGEINLSGIELFNLNGQLLFSSDDQDESIIELDLSSLESGIYILKLNTPEGTMTNRIIKTK